MCFSLYTLRVCDLTMAEFVEYKKDGMWEYFWRDKQGHSVKCKICTSILKATHGSTKGLHEHLKRLHSCNILKRKADDEPQPSTSKCSTGPGPMKKYLIETGGNSLPAALSRHSACDGLSFRVIATSKDLRRGLTPMGHSHVPTLVESIRHQVLKHGQVIRSVVMADLDRKKRRRMFQHYHGRMDLYTQPPLYEHFHARGGHHWSLGLL